MGPASRGAGRDGETLPRDEERTQRAVQAYTQRLTEDTLDAVGWFSCTLSELGYTAPVMGSVPFFLLYRYFGKNARENPLYFSTPLIYNRLNHNQKVWDINKPPPLRPPGVHPVKHLGPVLGLGAPGSGMDGQNHIGAVILPGEQGLHPLRRQRPEADLLRLCGGYARPA